MRFRGIFDKPVECIVVTARTPCHPGGAAAGVLGGGFVVAGTEAAGADGAGGASGEDGDEGADGGEAGGDYAHAGFGGGPDGGVGVVPWEGG